MRLHLRKLLDPPGTWDVVVTGPAPTATRTDAVLSDDGLYRYSLLRRWGTGTSVTWIMLNPSTADATVNDPTIRRCIGFTRLWGHDAIRVVNLYAFRATNPDALRTAADPVGPDNDGHIRRAVDDASLVVAAWGAHTGATRRAYRLRFQLVLPDRMCCLGVTKGGHPRHPLYVPNSATPVSWEVR
jgi:hypothetical protein